MANAIAHRRGEVPYVLSLLARGPLAPYDYQHEDPNREILFFRHDGHADKYPKQAHREGSGWTQLDRDHAHSKYWRGVVGTFLAHRTGLDAREGRCWHVADWPEGYTFWVKTNQQGRIDYYLYGEENGAFRSPIEFMFHAWYLNREDENTACKCTNCTDRPQNEINYVELGKEPAITRQGRVVQAANEMEVDELDEEDPPPRREPRAGFPAADVDRDKRIKRLFHHDFRYSLHDVIDIPAPEFPRRTADFQDNVMFRAGEVVWVRIPPIRSEDTSIAIEWWPAVITRWRPKLNAPHLKEYSFTLLGARGENEDTILERSIVPYNAYKFSNEMIRLVSRHKPSPQLVGLLDRLSAFYPVPPPNNVGLQLARNWSNGLTGFALGIESADVLAHHFSPTNPWQFQVAETDEAEKRFQGVWFGPERIWLGDVVRLTVPVEQLKDENIGHGLLQSSSGAEEKGLLLFVTGIIYDRGDDIGNLIFSGTLYDLAGPGVANRQMIRNLQGVRAEPLPGPPPGHSFRRLSPEGKEVRIPFKYVAGRYYDISNLRRRFENTISSDSAVCSRLEQCASLKIVEWDELPVLDQRKRKDMVREARSSATNIWRERWRRM